MRQLAVHACSSSLAWLAASFLAPAIADESSDADAEPSDDVIEEIIVTGSRLWINTMAPVTVVTRRDIERGGANSIADALQALPMNVGSPLNTNVNIGGAEPLTDGPSGNGSSVVELRGQRTVVLLNGRRFSSSDLNTIPLALVDHIEVLASGAGAAYGEGAVGGVINIITRRGMVGFALTGSQSITAQGDGAITTAAATAGLDLFGGTWMLGIDQVKQDGVTLDRRGYSAMPLVIIDSHGTLGPFRNPGMPQGFFRVPEGNAFGVEPGVYTRVDGATGQTAADYRVFDPATESFNFAPYNYSQTPNERASLWLNGSQPLGERVNLFVEGLLHHRESAQQAAPEAYFAGRDEPPIEGSVRGVPADNYYNPFGVDLEWAPRSLPVARRFVELGNREVRQEEDRWRVLVGLEYRAADWGWTLSFSHFEENSAEVRTGTVDWERVVRATGSSGLDDAGRVVCGQPDTTGRVPEHNIVPGCVPLNFFGGVGTITEEQLNYIGAGPIVWAWTNREQMASLVVSGSWGKFAGQDLQWVLGSDYNPDALAPELFAEMIAPLLRDRRWARELDLNLGLRRTATSSSHSNFATQVGLHWQPAEEWTLRANYAEVFNAPDAWALHEPPTYDRYGDPGINFDPCGNAPTDSQRENCAANGVPDGAYVQTEALFDVVYGGNPELEPETGYSTGAGMSYSPGWAQGLSLNVDYFYNYLSDLLYRFSVPEALFECAEYGLSLACDGITRYPDGSIQQVSTFNVNMAWPYESHGVDFAIDWSATTPLGEVNSRLLATRLISWDEQHVNGTELSWEGTFDFGAMPQWRGLAFAELVRGRWWASYSAEYIGSYTQRVEATFFSEPFDPFVRRIESVLYHDIEGAFEFDNGIAVRVAISNVTDEDPPFVNLASPANTDAGSYRLLGRTYFLELRYDSLRGRN